MCPYVSTGYVSTNRLPRKARVERGKRLQQRELWQTVRTRLPVCLQKMGFPMKGRRGQEIYGFAKEVSKMYMVLHANPEDVLHVSRKQTLEQALSAVFSEKDAESLAYGGDLEEALHEVGDLMHVSPCFNAYVLMLL